MENRIYSADSAFADGVKVIKHVEGSVDSLLGYIHIINRTFAPPNLKDAISELKKKGVSLDQSVINYLHFAAYAVASRSKL